MNFLRTDCKRIVHYVIFAKRAQRKTVSSQIFRSKDDFLHSDEKNDIIIDDDGVLRNDKES
jgi:hypothetical protein